ncbi:hypothetical protein GCM10027359_08650 [Marilutibacter aestuarii]|uniref:TraR/DksA family transcriptional regulator n=3 Tax=Lysobacteraceae TaxID=32033 RepID=A0A508AQL1_9GAMM|nr:TraR/DksA family transcriptional regulator [Lysobacter spongiae]TQD51223.1 TraR/DksA family transcriptional regulator [Lysobacter aestuarii]
MPDQMDQVQAMNELHTENALRTHARRERSQGLTHCENLDCGEPIAAVRQAMGARLCVPCQKGEEAAAAHQRAWRR